MRVTPTDPRIQTFSEWIPAQQWQLALDRLDFVDRAAGYLRVHRDDPDLIERIARVQARIAVESPPGLEYGTVSEFVEGWWPTYIHQAHAILSALQEDQG